MIGRRGVLAIAAVVAARRAAAEGEATVALSPAQVALFETPHLADLHAPVRLDYRFRREEAGKPVVEDSIRLLVRDSSEPGRRDVSVEFLTGPRAIEYPPARGFRGNPLLLFVLDRETRELSAATGGSTLWFRNRIRHAYEAAEPRAEVAALDGRNVPATAIEITPFQGEPRARRYQALRLGILLAEAVPGRIHTIRTELPEGEEGGRVVESVTFAGTAPLPEPAR